MCHNGILVYLNRLSQHVTAFSMFTTVIKKNIVDINKISCTCNKFQIDILPCKYVSVVLINKHQESYDYCLKYCTKEEMLATYQSLVYPIDDEDSWNVPEYVKNI